MPGLPMAVVERLAFALDVAQENGETEQLDAASYQHLGNMIGADPMRDTPAQSALP